VKWGKKMKDGIDLPYLSYRNVEYQIKEQLHRLLNNIHWVNDVDIYSLNNNECDFTAEATTDSGEKLIFFCEVKGSGEPRIIRTALENLRKYRDFFSNLNKSNACFLVGAPYISEKTSNICDEYDIGYIDLSGNCKIVSKGIYIKVEGKPNKYKDARKTTSVFERSAVKSSIILRTLLTASRKQWKVNELSMLTNTSLGQVSKVKKFLEEKELITNGEQGFYVSGLKELIKEWAKVYHEKPNTVVECYSIDPIPVIEKKLEELNLKKGIEYALTGFSGGARYAPVVRYNKVHVYIQYQDLQEALDFLGLKRVESGANISIIVPYDPCVMLDSRKIQGSIVASPAQVCLELLGLRGRGEEAAEAILDKEVVW